MEYVFSEPLIVKWAEKDYLSWYAGVEEGKIKVIFIELLKTKTYVHSRYLCTSLLITPYMFTSKGFICGAPPLV